MGTLFLTKNSSLLVYNIIKETGEIILIIYIDVLVTVNTVVNYYLLLLTAKLNSAKYKNLRLLFSAFAGGICSVCIFIPDLKLILNILLKISISIIMTLIAFGYRNLKIFLRNVFILFSISFTYAGAMLAISGLLKTKFIVINNSTVYFDISAVFLIVFSVVFYVILILVKSILKRKSITAKRCNVKIFFNNSIGEFTGIFDTGNSVKDILSNSEVIFINKKNAIDFLGDNPKNFKNKYRVLPCTTVTGSKLLEGICCDKSEITFDNSIIVLKKPILAISDSFTSSEYSVLLNPEILEYSEAIK